MIRRETISGELVLIIYMEKVRQNETKGEGSKNLASSRIWSHMHVVVIMHNNNDYYVIEKRKNK